MKLPLLLAEPNALLRQTVALTAQSIQVGPVLQAASLHLAQRMMAEQAFAAVILPLDSDETDGSKGMLELIQKLRSGATRSASSVPIFVTATVCNRSDAELLAAAGIQRMLIKPFKARLLLEALASAGDGTAATK